MNTNWQQSTVHGSRTARTAASPDADDRRLNASAEGNEHIEPKRAERGGSSPSSSKKPRRRKKRSIWLRLLRMTIVPILLLCSVVAGLYVGYSVFGNQSGAEVYQVKTWRHLYDLMFSKS
ncbi:DNA-directed RNA polymerase subunit beta [Paenibacillus xylaniclasticus]|uniref:DNA-directed RNA polymerase subunit beta n=1 Tax=Paenibacillus xylaniclasticus TaxID=588083 RepID=UPI000FD81601|nr:MULTISPECIES: DNA-directed RNA polymerase subunit beta [Paenibacillus]